VKLGSPRSGTHMHSGFAVNFDAKNTKVKFALLLNGYACVACCQ